MNLLDLGSNRLLRNVSRTGAGDVLRRPLTVLQTLGLFRWIIFGMIIGTVVSIAGVYVTIGW